MIIFLKRVTLASALLLSISTANAAAYTIDEIFTGNWTGIWGSPHSYFTHNGTSQSLVSGDASLFSTSVSTSEHIFDVTTCASCVGTELLKNGDQIFLTTDIAYGGGLKPSETSPGLLDNYYIGTITITGGTGLFSGASGSGSYTAIDYGVMSVDQSGNFAEFRPSGQWTVEQKFTVSTAAVPEPATYAMMLAGLGMMGFMVRRRNNEQA